MNRSKLIKMFVALIAILVLVGSLTRLFKGNSMSLTEYANLHATPMPKSETHLQASDAQKNSLQTDEDLAAEETASPSPEGGSSLQDSAETSGDVSHLTGAILNGSSQLEQRCTFATDFYYEPLSDSLRRYITGVSYPADPQEGEEPLIGYDQLRYVHILHYDFDGNPTEGELICNEAVAQDLVEIFYELYRNEYQLERVRLIDEYDGDDIASMEDNNTSCFNYREVEGTDSLSRHAYGLAVDINPLYNPYITYNEDGSQNVSPAAAESYADRSASFPYKINEDDLCYKLFTRHGFTWGGNWNGSKDYQHFQKAID